MNRIVFSAFIAFAAVSMAHAEDAQIITASSNPKATHARIVAVAEKLCLAARAHDPFDDFGTQEECVDNTVQDAHPRQVAREAGTMRISSAR